MSAGIGFFPSLFGLQFVSSAWGARGVWVWCVGEALLGLYKSRIYG
jgi:hypothetical protein